MSWDLKMMSAIERCPLLRGACYNYKKKALTARRAVSANDAA